VTRFPCSPDRDRVVVTGPRIENATEGIHSATGQRHVSDLPNVQSGRAPPLVPARAPALLGRTDEVIQMNRREFALLGSAIAGSFVWPSAADAQQGERVRRIGVLMNVVQDDPGSQADVAAFRQGLAELGWVEGRNIHIEFRWPGADIERAEAFARELVGLRPDVLVGRSTPTTAALKRETSTIPIVFSNVSEPVESGFVENLARPGGNITGFSNFEGSIGGKWLQLLKEVDPRIIRVAVMYNPQTAPFAGLFLRSVQSAAQTLAVTMVDMPVQSDAAIEAAMTEFARQPGGSLVSIPDSFTREHRDLVIALAARLRLPALYQNINSTPSGGLIAYAVDTLDLIQRAAGYVDRILKGAKPGDLPVQQPAKFQLSINLKTAKALGLDLPQILVARADEVIE
jgi:putative ABC transport system substrate-binding protein